MSSAVAVCLALAFLAGCAPAEVEGNLLGGREPTRVHRVRDAARITDGAVPRAGDAWRSAHTAVLADSSASVAWDLGAPTTLRFLYLQGDNNDGYEVEVSDDGTAFRSIWTAKPVAEGGMQERWAEIPPVEARWIRVRAQGGDGAYSLGEVAAFAEKPERWPPAFRRVGTGPLVPARLAIGIFTGLMALFVLGYRPGRHALFLLPAGAAAVLLLWLVPGFPARSIDVSLFKAALALLAALVLLRSWKGTGEDRLEGRATTAMLAAIAFLSVAAYHELGHLSFRNEKEGRPTFVHTWDMRHYFPLAKYFPELRFDGLYFASAAAWIEDEGGVSPARLSRRRIRDLRNNQVTTLDQVQDAIAEVKGRFTPERWASFREDMRWFRETMGVEGYLGTMVDHGGNGTPVWLLGGWLVFSGLSAGEWALSLTGLVDPLLLALMFLCIARTFGMRAMLVCLIVFGITDFAKFGATLVGSSLRYDWLAALGMGVCALRTGRWALGGALLAWSGLIRAFPALALFFLAVPVIFEAIRLLRQRGKLPPLREVEGAVPLLHTAAGAGIAVVVLVGLSVALFSWEAGWGAWFEKIVPHADKPNVNHVGLRTVIAYEAENVASRIIDWQNPEPWWRWQQTQMAAWEARRPIYLLAAAAMIGLVAFAARRRRLDQAALLGMLLVPALFYPANYYYHYVLLLPLVAVGTRREEGDGPPEPAFVAVTVAVLALCGLQYFTLLEPWTDECFTWQTWLLLGAFVATAGTMIAAAQRSPDPAAATAVAGRRG